MSTFLLNDSAPATLAQGFETPADPSTDVYWGGPVSMAFDADVGGVNGTASPAGVQMLASVGAALATGAALASPTGQQIISAVGTSVATGASQGAPAGLAITSSVGTPVATGTALASPQGVEMVSAVGTAVASSESPATAAPAGVEMAAAVGQATATGDASAAPAGFEMVSAVGTAVADGGPADGLAEPLGVEMVASVGQAYAYDADAVVQPTGGGGWSPRYRQAEELTERVSVTVYPFGVAMAARVGQATATGTATITATGVSMAAQVGTPAVTSSVTVDVQGVAMLASVGTPDVFDLHVMAVAPYTPFRRDAVAAPLGVEAVASVGDARADGTDALDKAWQHLQADEDELLILGVIA